MQRHLRKNWSRIRWKDLAGSCYPTRRIHQSWRLLTTFCLPRWDTQGWSALRFLRRNRKWVSDWTNSSIGLVSTTCGKGAYVEDNLIKPSISKNNLSFHICRPDVYLQQAKQAYQSFLLANMRKVMKTQRTNEENPISNYTSNIYEFISFLSKEFGIFRA